MCKRAITHVYKFCGHPISEPGKILQCAYPKGALCLLVDHFMGSVKLKEPCDSCIEAGAYVKDMGRWTKVE